MAPSVFLRSGQSRTRRPSHRARSMASAAASAARCSTSSGTSRSSRTKSRPPTRCVVVFRPRRRLVQSVLNHHRADGRQVEHLPGPIARAVPTVESGPAPVTRGRTMVDHPVRVADLLQPPTRFSLGPARLAPGGLAQRLRRRLLAQPVWTAAWTSCASRKRPAAPTPRSAPPVRQSSLPGRTPAASTPPPTQPDPRTRAAAGRKTQDQPTGPRRPPTPRHRSSRAVLNSYDRVVRSRKPAHPEIVSVEQWRCSLRRSCFAAPKGPGD